MSFASSANLSLVTGPLTSRSLRFGGRVISNVVIQPVFVGQGVRMTSQLTQFYKAVVTGNFIDFLSQEYSISNQKIGAGTTRTPVYVGDVAAGSMQQSQIEGLLTSLITAGVLPPPNANLLYAMHFAPGISMMMNGGYESCVYWCGIHGGFNYVNGSTTLRAYYQLLPDFSQQYSPGCYYGCAISRYDESEKVQIVASHEVAEVITDPDVAFAGGLSWYNWNDGENADYCNGQAASVLLGDGNK